MGFIDKYFITGKKIPFFFYAKGVLFGMVPRRILNRRRKRMLKGWESRPDAGYLRTRRDYYCALPENGSPCDGEIALKDIRLGKVKSRYAVDAAMVFRYFPAEKRINLLAGDCWSNPSEPTIIKARRIGENWRNAVILKMDSVFLYMKPKDKVPFCDKKPVLFFRGKIHGKPRRVEFFKKWAGHKYFDLGDTDSDPAHKTPWNAPFMKIYEHFNYQFILTLEGNDVSSSLQWVMASNCVPVMPKPTVESWMMESKMIPGVHYIEIAADFSDAAEKIGYYVNHPDEAEKISVESRKWAEQFFDHKREKIISLLVAEKYFDLTSGSTK